jgi:hypothetical protein
MRRRFVVETTACILNRKAAAGRGAKARFAAMSDEERSALAKKTARARSGKTKRRGGHE